METAMPLSDQVLGREAEALRSIIEMLPTGIVLIDAEGNLLFHNRAAREILGAEDAERGGPSEWTSAFGWYLPDKTTLLFPEELPMVRALRGESIYDALLFVRNASRPDGVWISATVRPLRDDRGRINSAVMMCRESERRAHVSAVPGSALASS